jgi:toxin ParE1/3/4
MITVSFSADAERDLLEIKAYVAAVAGSSVAEAYVLRLYRHCMSLSTFPQRGVRRDEIRRGMRTLGYRRIATIAFLYREQEVVILRVFHKGRDVDFEEFSASV